MTFSQLPLISRESIQTEWSNGASGRTLDVQYGLTPNTVTKVAFRQRWVRARDYPTGRSPLPICEPPSPPPTESVSDDQAYKQAIEIERLSGRLNQMTRQYKQAVKEKVAIDRLIEVAKDAIIAADPVAPLPIELPKDNGLWIEARGEHRVVALVSDVHVGEVVSAKETNYLGRYDSEIFKERLNTWTTKVVELVNLRRQRLSVPNLSVFLLGDIVSGDIHEELSNTNDGSIVDQVVLAAQQMSSALLTLAPEFEHIEVAGVVGNHGRMRKKPYFKGKQPLNWDYLIYQIMQMSLSQQGNISFHIPESFFTIRDVLGTRFLLIHGDGNVSWAGIPYYGVERSTLKLQDLVGRFEPFDRVVMGHFHDPVDTERWHINGSFKGADEFSISKLYKGARPSQTLLYVHPKHGVVGSERIYLDEPWEMRIRLDDTVDFVNVHAKGRN